MGKYHLNNMKISIFWSIFALAAADCGEKKKSWKECRNWASFMPGSYWTWNPENNRCGLKRNNNGMHEAKGHHSGDHAGSKHWIDKKIVNGNCDSCAPGGCAP